MIKISSSVQLWASMGEWANLKRGSVEMANGKRLVVYGYFVLDSAPPVQLHFCRFHGHTQLRLRDNLFNSKRAEP